MYLYLRIISQHAKCQPQQTRWFKWPGYLAILLTCSHVSGHLCELAVLQLLSPFNVLFCLSKYIYIHPPDGIYNVHLYVWAMITIAASFCYMQRRSRRRICGNHFDANAYHSRSSCSFADSFEFCVIHDINTQDFIVH